MYWGKLVGIVFGFLLFKSLGAALGLMVGHIFDNGLRANLRPRSTRQSKIVQQTFFEATFTIMGYLAKLDGRVSQDEIKAARAIMARLSLSEQQRINAMHLFNRGKQATFKIESVLLPLMQQCGGYYDLLRFFIQVLLDLALADGPLSDKEYQTIITICHRLNCNTNDFPRLKLYKQQYQRQRQQQYYKPKKIDPIQNAYEILGISSRSEKKQIKIAYRRLMNMHHPDKLISKGLPPEMLKLAKEKTQEIRAAYDLIKQQRGF